MGAGVCLQAGLHAAAARGTARRGGLLFSESRPGPARSSSLAAAAGTRIRTQSQPYRDALLPRDLAAVFTPCMQHAHVRKCILFFSHGNSHTLKFVFFKTVLFFFGVSKRIVQS